ncbi:MAG: hypothetical protein PHH43_04965 [Candidatus Cloacimonetes bacterium]|nr:hypothetical protein [Candidatus Cloacimonadota bacterium]
MDSIILCIVYLPCVKLIAGDKIHKSAICVKRFRVINCRYPDKVRFAASGANRYDINNWYIDNISLTGIDPQDPVSDLGITLERQKKGGCVKLRQ